MKNSLIVFKQQLEFAIIALALVTPQLSFGQNTLKGNLKNQLNGEAVSGALIRIADSFNQTESDRNGNFIFSSVNKKELTLYIQHISFERDTVTVAVGTDEININLLPRIYMSQEITVSATRADRNSGVAYTTINKETLEARNLGQDIPYLLQSSPSFVATSDAGNGIGYTGMRIRGSDPTRINVTINGVPVNDAESHQVYLVDLPDLVSSTENIQIQRGIGTSSNGAGAFGGSVNIQTLTLDKKPYATLNSSAGSFNTFKNTIGFGSGMISDNFSLNGNVSMIKSDGFVDRGSSDLKSLFLSGGYYGKHSSIRLMIMSGKERTYQSWYGVPQDSLKSNRTFNPAGMYYDSNGVLQYYADQTDNYQQDNYQLHYTRAINHNWTFNLSLHGTLGKGYYQEYSSGDAFSTYDLNDAIVGNDTLTSSDFIRQRWLDNDFYGAIATTHYQSKKVRLTLGAGTNVYDGTHFGELIWSKDQVLKGIPQRYYEDDALKKELNFYTKVGLPLMKKLEMLLDLQFRNINYEFEGRESGGNFLPTTALYSFFNPKIGLTYSLPKDQRIYFSAGVGQKEPIRDDFVNSTVSSRPKAEKLIDYEAGYEMHKKKVRLGMNLYYMHYKDQLILNGKINDVGEYTRQNVDLSYRKGIELELIYLISNNLRFEGNISLSQNEIKDFEEYIDDYDAGVQVLRKFERTDIAFSPSAIAFALISWKPVHAVEINLSGKYVGKQYLDNSESNSRSIDPYLLNDLQLSYTIHPGKIKEIGLKVHLNNLLDVNYNANGYTYSYIYSGELSTFNYYFPQAGRNIMIGLNLRF